MVWRRRRRKPSEEGSSFGVGNEWWEMIRAVCVPRSLIADATAYSSENVLLYVF
jgi:hypothetical protein